MKDLRELLPYMDADITTFGDYSVNHPTKPRHLQLHYLDVVLFLKSIYFCFFSCFTDTVGRMTKRPQPLSHANFLPDLRGTDQLGFTGQLAIEMEMTD